MNDDLIFSTLEHPRVLDGFGNLYVLRQEDGATVFVAGTDSHQQLQFMETYSSEKTAWLSSHDKAYFLIDDGKRYLVDFSEDPLPRASRRSTYARMFHVEGRSAGGFLVRSTDNGLTCYSIAKDVRKLCQPLPMRGFCGWESDDCLHVGGMHPRIKTESERDYTLKKGGALIVKIDRRTGDIQPLLAGDGIDKQLNDERAVTSDSNPGVDYSQYCVEAWLCSFGGPKQIGLIGGIVDGRPSEDEIYVNEEPDWRDFEGFGMFGYHEGKATLYQLLMGFAPLQVVPAAGRQLLYAFDRRENNAIRNINCLVLKVGDKCEPIRATIDGLDGDALLGNFRVQWDATAGFVGIIDIIRRGVESFLVLSKDGLSWRVAHQLRSF